MLRRIALHFSLILLFAFTQMGVATHAISHIADGHEQHEQEKNSHEEQCGQCISLSHLAGADTVDSIRFSFTPTAHVLTTHVALRFSSATLLLQSARGPPNSQV